MANGTIMPSPVFTGWDDNGDPLSGGLLYTCVAGTGISTPQATFSDVGLTTPNANPVVLNAAGRATVFLSPTSYLFILKTSAGATVWTQDNISAVPTTSGEVDITAIAGEALAAGTVAYLSKGDGGRTAGRWYLADGDLTYASSAADTIGMVPTAIASGETGTVRRDGRITGLSALTAGTAYYASGTAGALTATLPTYPRLVGTADTTTSLVLNAAPVFAAAAPAFTVAAAANALTFTLTTSAGVAPTVQPVRLTFRDATAATGTVTTIDVVTATTLTVPDTATLGTSNNVAFRLWVVAFNDAGTVRLGVINCAGSGSVYPLGGWGLASSTAMTTGSDSAQVLYTGSAVTSKAYTLLGYVTYESGLATAGTWSAAPTRSQPYTSEVRLPGQPVQSVFATYATETGNATSTFADTGLTATITPTSAANKVRAQVHQNGLYKDGTATGITIRLQSAGVDVVQMTAGANPSFTAGTNVGFATASTTYIDAPNTSSAVIYKTRFRSTANAATAYVQQGSARSTIELTEVMQ